MKITVNLKKILKLNPCKDRLKNYLKHYKSFEGPIENFLDLGHITYNDKLWVALRLVPRIVLEAFAIDCAMRAAGADYAAYAAYAAADAAAEAANAANAANAAYTTAYAHAYERHTQIESLIYLIQTHKPEAASYGFVDSVSKPIPVKSINAAKAMIRKYNKRGK